MQSRYYDPALCRFLNADGLASTGQGILGCNMFAYCGNNPRNNSDSSGEYFTPGQIHDSVLEDICKRDPNKQYKDNYMTYKEKYLWHSFGYCDLYDRTTQEVWELKRIGGGATCKYAAAQMQLDNYVNNGVFKKKNAGKLVKGGTHSSVEANVYVKPDNDGEGYYVIGYFDAGGGVLFYDYMYVPSAKEAATAVAAVGAGITIAEIVSLIFLVFA